MNVSLEKDYYLRISDFDRFGRLKASSILDIFQDIAASHANDIGIGFEAMIANKTIWVLTKVKFEVLKNPKLYETVHVKTWPLKPGKICFQREYYIEDLEGNPVVKGTSEWVVIHSEKRRMVAAGDIFPIKEGFLTDVMFEEKLKKIPDFESTNEPYCFKTTFSDCDINGHVNNTKYANYVFDALDFKEPVNIKTFQIDYCHEVVSGTDLHIHFENENGIVNAKGTDDNGDKKFACHIELFK